MTLAAAVRERIAATVRDDVQVIERYHVPDARGFVKLDAMENPYSLPANIARGDSVGKMVSRSERWPRWPCCWRKM